MKLILTILLATLFFSLSGHSQSKKDSGSWMACGRDTMWVRYQDSAFFRKSCDFWNKLEHDVKVLQKMIEDTPDEIDDPGQPNRKPDRVDSIKIKRHKK